MKGSPEYSRKSVTASIFTPYCRGLSHSLRSGRGKVLVKGPDWSVLNFDSSVWLTWSFGRLCLAVRLCAETFQLQSVRGRRTKDGFLRIECKGSTGAYTTYILIRSGGSDSEMSLKTTLRVREATSLDPSGYEVVLFDRHFNPLREGRIYTAQKGPAGSHCFVGAEDVSVFYFQNLTSLSESGFPGDALAGSVGVDWPELGCKLPPRNELIKAGSEVVLSDSRIIVRKGLPPSEGACAERFLDHLWDVIAATSPRQQEWVDWANLAKHTVTDLARSQKCVRSIKGEHFFNAYVGSSEKPPESMVQAAIRVSLHEYEQWLGKQTSLGAKLGAELSRFFMPELGFVARWLPGTAFPDNPSDEEATRTMDSWYLLHTMLNLARLADQGCDLGRELFTRSLPYILRVAHRFNYDWPVFYDIKTLRVIRRETEPGFGGEQDVAGLYAHVMLQAFEMTREQKYLDEAVAAAEHLKGLGFGVLYQTNNTMFCGVALARLWRQTGDLEYRNLSLVCLGSIFSHLWLWEAHDPGREWRTFMGLPPLHDAPYVAAYEEAELFATLDTYVKIMGDDIPWSLLGIIAEYRVQLLGRGHCYFPQLLPEAYICNEPKEGVTNPFLTIPLEDVYPSLQKNGQVGQEVYGSALALTLAVGSLTKIPDLPFIISCGAPVLEREFSRFGRRLRGQFRIVVANHPSRSTRIRLIPKPGYDLRIVPSKQRMAATRMRKQPRSSPEAHLVFDVRGNVFAFDWTASKKG